MEALGVLKIKFFTDCCCVVTHFGSELLEARCVNINVGP